MPRLDPPLTAQLLSIWHAAASVSPTGGPAPAPPPIVSARTFRIVRAVKPLLVTRGGTYSAFVAAWIGAPDDADGTYEALNINPDAPVGGILYNRLLGYLTNGSSSQPPGLGAPNDQAVADLADVWASAPTFAS